MEEDIYQGLVDFSHQEIEQLLETCRSLHRKNIELTESTRLLEEKVKSLTASREVLRRNFSSLLLTAKAEIERKDARLKELQTSLDESMIRGNRRGANSSHLEAMIERRARELADRWQERQRSESPETDGTRRPRHSSLPNKGRKNLSDKRRKKRRGIADVVACLDKNNATVCVANSSISLSMDQIPWERRKTITLDQSLVSPRQNDQSQAAAAADDQSHTAGGVDDQSVRVVKVVNQSRRNPGREGQPGELRTTKKVRISDTSGERVLEAPKRQPRSSQEAEAQNAKHISNSSQKVSHKCDSPSRVSECSETPAGASHRTEKRDGGSSRGNISETKSASDCVGTDKDDDIVCVSDRCKESGMVSKRCESVGKVPEKSAEVQKKSDGAVTDKDDDIVSVNGRSKDSDMVSKRSESVGKAPEKSTEVHKTLKSLEKCEKMKSPSRTSRCERQTFQTKSSLAVSSNKDPQQVKIVRRNTNESSRPSDGAAGGGKSSVQLENSAGRPRRKAPETNQPRAGAKKGERSDVTSEVKEQAGDTGETLALSKTKAKRGNKSADSQNNTLTSPPASKKPEQPPPGHGGDEPDDESDSSMYITNWEEESSSVPVTEIVSTTKLGKDSTFPLTDSNNREKRQLPIDHDEEQHIFSPPANPVDANSNSGGRKVHKRRRRSRVSLGDSDSSVMSVAQESDAEHASMSVDCTGTSTKSDPPPRTVSQAPSEITTISEDVSNQNSSKFAKRRLTAKREESKQQSADGKVSNSDGSETTKRRDSETASNDDVILEVEFCVETPAGSGESRGITSEKDAELQKDSDTALHKPSNAGEEAASVTVPQDPTMSAYTAAGSRDILLLKEGTQDQSLRNMTGSEELVHKKGAENSEETLGGEVGNSKDPKQTPLEQRLKSMLEDSADSDLNTGICEIANAASPAARWETTSRPVLTCAEVDEVAGERLVARPSMEVGFRSTEIGLMKAVGSDSTTPAVQRTKTSGAVSGETSVCSVDHPKPSRSSSVDQPKPFSSGRVSKTSDDVRQREGAAWASAATPRDKTILGVSSPRQSQCETQSFEPASSSVAPPLQRGNTSDHESRVGPDALSKASLSKGAPPEKLVPGSGKLTTALQVPGAELSALTTPVVSAKSTKRAKSGLTCPDRSESAWTKSSTKVVAGSDTPSKDENLVRNSCAGTNSVLPTELAEQGKTKKSLPQAGKPQSLEAAHAAEGVGQTDVNALQSTSPASPGHSLSIQDKFVESEALIGKSPRREGNERLKLSPPEKAGLSSPEEMAVDEEKACPAQSEPSRYQGPGASPPAEQDKDEEGSGEEESPCKSATLTSSSPRSESSSEDSSSDDKSSSEESDSSDSDGESDSDENSEASEDDEECSVRPSDGNNVTLTKPEGMERTVDTNGKSPILSHTDKGADAKSDSDLPQGNLQDVKATAGTSASQCSLHDQKFEQMAVKVLAKKTECELKKTAVTTSPVSKSPRNNDNICQTKGSHVLNPHENSRSVSVPHEDEAPEKNGGNTENNHPGVTERPPCKQLVLSPNNVVQLAPISQVETSHTEDSESDYHLNVDLDEDDLDYEPETPVGATLEDEEVSNKAWEDQADPTSEVNDNCLQPSMPQRGGPGKANVKVPVDVANDEPLNAPTVEKSKDNNLIGGNRSRSRDGLENASTVEHKQGTDNKDEDDEWEEGEIVDDSSPSPRSRLDSGSQHSLGSVRSGGSGRRIPLTTVARSLKSFKKWSGISQEELWSEVLTGGKSGSRMPRKGSLEEKEDIEGSSSGEKRRTSHERPAGKLISGRSPSKQRTNPGRSLLKPCASARYRSPTKLTRTKVSPRGKLSHRSPLKRNDLRDKLAHRLSHLEGANERARSQDRRQARARLSDKNRLSSSQTPICSAGPSRQSLPRPGGDLRASTSREPGNPTQHHLLKQARERPSSPDRYQALSPISRLLESQNNPGLSGLARRSSASQEEDGELPSRPGDRELRSYVSHEDDVLRRRTSRDVDEVNARRTSRESDRDEDSSRYQRHKAERVVEQDERRATRPELGHPERVRQRHDDSRNVLRDRRLSENSTSPCRRRPSPREERSSSREKRSWSRVQTSGASDRVGPDRGRYSDTRLEEFRDRREQRRERLGGPRFGPNRRSDENNAHHWRRPRERYEEREGKPDGKYDGRPRKRSREWSQDRESKNEDDRDGKRKHLSSQRDDEHGRRLSDSRRLHPESERMRGISEEPEKICFETPKKSGASDMLSEDGRNLSRYLDAFINHTPYHEESMSLFASAVERRALPSKKTGGEELGASSSSPEFPKLGNGKGGSKESIEDGPGPTQKPQTGLPTSDESKVRSTKAKDPDTVRRTSSSTSSKNPEEHLPKSQAVNVSERTSSKAAHSTAQHTALSPSHARVDLQPVPQDYDDVSRSVAPDISHPEVTAHPISSVPSQSESTPDSLSQSRSLSHAPRFKRRRRRGPVCFGDSGTEVVETTSPEAPASAPREDRIMVTSGDDVFTTRQDSHQRDGDVDNISVTPDNVPTRRGITSSASPKDSSALVKDVMLPDKLSPLTPEEGKQPARAVRSDSSPDTLERLAREAERLCGPVVLTNEDSEASLLTYFRNHES